MPIFNERGELAYGREGLAWLTPDTLIAQKCGQTECQIQTAPRADGPWQTVANKGCSALVASHDRWMAHLVGYGVFWADPSSQSGESLVPGGAAMALGADIQAGRALTSPDGTIPLLLEYQQGRGLRLVATDGSYRDYPDVHPRGQVAVLDRTRALFDDWVTKRVETVGGLPRPVNLELPCYWPTVLEHQGRFWILYHGQSEIIFRAFDDPTLRWVLPAGYYPHAMMHAGDVLVAWASTPDDASGPPPVRIDVSVIPPPEPVDPPVPQPEIGEIMLPAFSHYGLVAPYFSDGRGYGFTEEADRVGNAVLLVEDPRDPNVLVSDIEEVVRRNPNAILILQGDGPAQIPERFWNQTVALWCSGGNPDQLGEAVQRCINNRPAKRIIAYLDGRGWPDARPHWVTDVVCPNVQAYRHPTDEVLASFEANLEVVLQRVKAYGRPLGISPRFDNYNGDGSVPRTLECMPLYERWTREYQLVDFLPFADRREGTNANGTPIIGMKSSPELRAWGKAFFYAFPERPGRYDYWMQPGQAMEDRMRNKLGQSRLAVTLEAEDREYLTGLMDTEIPPPIEPPEPGNGVEPDQMLPIVEAVWQKYGGHQDPGPEGIAHMINEIAWRGNGNRAEGRWMLSHKPGGNRVRQPRTGIFVAYDVVQDGPTDPHSDPPGHFHGYDCFGGEPTGPSWGESHQHNDPNRVGVAPVAPL